MTTHTLINMYSSLDFITKDQAAQLADVALKQFTRRSKQAKAVVNAVHDMVLANGCPNAVRDAVINLMRRYF